ncbi:MAG: alpha-glucosidase [Phycisphaerales bacterium]|nr:MAG: alpha-glucosidase [Phycisphaerales bacterium]
MLFTRFSGCLAAVAIVASCGLAAPTTTTISEGVFRYDLSPEAREHALPSMSFLHPDRREGEADSSRQASTLPQIEWRDGVQHVFVGIEPGTSLYGTGEVPGQLLRNGRVNINWNTDAYAYGIDSPSLYQSHPWVLAVRPDGTSFGVLADTTWRSTFDLREGIRIHAEGPAYPVIIIERDHPAEVVEKLADLTGTIEMPPKWALGYHQCRYSYYPESRVREIATEFRERNIPADVIWMDIDYMDGFRIFTFDNNHFPDPAGLNEWLAGKGFRNVWMINPGVKAEEGFFVYDSGTENDVWVKLADGRTPFRGEVWPGMCVFPDYLSERVREWWAPFYKDFMAQGVDGVWNDMNEPAIFGVESKTMPEDNFHNADEAFGGPGTHAQFHNVYGMMMIRATHQGVLAANPNKRPFVLSRANFIGGHRYGATWSGDNVAAWDHLEWSVPMTLNLGLSGQPFNGPDIGGFAGNGSPEMFQRWMGFGALLPFARGHTGKGNIDKEPWSFGPEVEATSRRAIQRRYALMPHIYTAFWQAHRYGTPVARPLFYADPADPAIRSEDDAFLLGDGLLVKCFMNPQMDRTVVMPRGIWRQFDFRDRIEGDHSDPHLPQLYVQDGRIIPAGPVMQFVDEMPLDPLTLIISPDEQGAAEGLLYEDAGDGFEFRQPEGRRLTRYSAAISNNTLTIEREDIDGEWPREPRTVRVILLTDEGMLTADATDAPSIRIDLSNAERID